MKPGKTYLPVASMTSVSGGASKFTPIVVIVSFSNIDIGSLAAIRGDYIAIANQERHISECGCPSHRDTLS